MATTRISERGQVVIPKEIREQLGLERGQVLEVEEWEGVILMRPRMQTGGSPAGGWRAWRGALEGSGALEDLEAEHRREVERAR